MTEDNEDRSESPPKPDYTAIRLLLLLCAVEVGILYALIALDTPLAPPVRLLIQKPSGVIILVMSVVTVLLIAMSIVLMLRKRWSQSPKEPG